MNGSKQIKSSKKMQTSQHNQKMGEKMVCAGSAACVADIMTFPLDVAKVRLQLSSSVVKQISSSSVIALQASGLGPQYSGLLGTLFGMARNEGLKSLYGGIVPGLQRQCVFASIRVGLYEPVKDFYTKHTNFGDSTASTMIIRIASGITTGAIGITCAQVCPHLKFVSFYEILMFFVLIYSRLMS